MILRPYQDRTVADVGAVYRDGHAGVALVLPTGAGKTVIFSRMAQAITQAGGVTLIVVPRVELVRQACDKLRRFGVRYGTIAAEYPQRDAGAPVQVATAQTLVRRPRAMVRAPSLIVLDECHLAAADTWRKILARHVGVRVLGCTATLTRLDGQGFAFASAIVEGPRVPDLIDLWRGDPSVGLVPFRTYSVPLIDADKIKRTSGGEYDHDAQSQAWARTGLVGDVVEHYRERAAGRSGIVFASSISHSRALAAGFAAAGMVAEHVDGETPPDARAATLARLDAGVTQIVCNFGVLIEGFDCPRVSAIVLARATASVSLWLQSAGRGLRPFTGKTDCVILDHGGNGRRHGNLDFARAWSLHGRDKRERERAGDLGRECPQCALVVPLAAGECPQCGHDFTAKKDRTPETVAGALELLPSGAAPLDAPRAPDRVARPAGGRAAAVDRAQAWADRWAGRRANS